MVVLVQVCSKSLVSKTKWKIYCPEHIIFGSKTEVLEKIFKINVFVLNNTNEDLKYKTNDFITFSFAIHAFELVNCV